MDLWNLLYGNNGTGKVTDDDLKDYMGDNEYLTADYMFFGNNSKSVNGFIGISIPLGAKKSDVI